jgi:serine protease Do
MMLSKGNLGFCLAASLGTVVLVAASVHAEHARTPPLADVSPQARQAIESANSLSSAFRAVANQLLPSVVAIENRPAIAWNSHMSAKPSSDGFGGQNPFQGTPFEKMFPNFNDQLPPMNKPGGSIPAPQSGIGSGVIIDESGIILTNNHVVAGDGKITVRTQDGRTFVATNVWTDPKSDLAVVKIENASDLVAATLGDSDQVEIGDWVMALGQPFGLESTVTAGIISAKHRGIGITARENFLQTDAAINPGNSGGPLVNLRGEVIGINTAIHSRSGGNNGIGFAVPSNLARWVSDQLVNTGTVKRAYLGVGIQPVTQELAKQLSVKPRGGVLVTDVYPDTPAAKTGLHSGDVIVRFGNTAVATPQALQLAVERSPLGEQISIEIVRHGKTMNLTYQVTEQPSEFAARFDGEPAAESGKRMEGFGIEIAAMDSEVAKRLGMQGTEGVVITSVRDGGAAAAAGLAPGMVIVEVEHQKVSSVSEFEEAIEKNRNDSDDGTLLLVRTAKGSRFVVVKS